MPEDTGRSALPGNHHDQLTGWKEIANYFRKGVRTVQRWEADLAMPVRRIRTGRGETVYAFPAELEAWRRALDARPPQVGWDRDDEDRESNDGIGSGAHAGPDGRSAGVANGGATRAANAGPDGWTNGVANGRAVRAASAKGDGSRPASGDVHGGPAPASSRVRSGALTALEEDAVTGRDAGARPDGEQGQHSGSAAERAVAVDRDHARNPLRRRFMQVGLFFGVVAAVAALTVWRLGWPGRADTAAARHTAQGGARTRTEALASGLPGQPTALGAASAGEPSDDIRIDLDTVRVFDADGQLVFEHQFELPFEPAAYRPDEVMPSSRRFQVSDLDGDGTREVVFVNKPGSGTGPDSLVVFEATGDIRFDIRPQARVRFGDSTYAPPWNAHRLFVTGAPDRLRVWVAWIDGTQHQFPCLLQQVSSRGTVLGEYWNAGYVESMSEVIVGKRRLVAVGAANNDHKAASLAFLDPDAFSGAAPAESWDKTCVDCPSGQPEAFLVFPRMGLDVPGNTPFVMNVTQDVDGNVNAVVHHQGPDPSASGGVLYWLGTDLVPRRAEVSPDYVLHHQWLHKAGRYDHPFGDRDMRDAWPVLVWKGGKRFDPVTGITTR